MTRDATANCAWCAATFEVPDRPGPTPRYCKPSHRQRAHEARRLDALTRPHDLDMLRVAHDDAVNRAGAPQPDWRHAFLALARAVAAAIGTPPPTLASHPRRPPRPTPAETIYECPECEQRYLGERRCPDCNLFCRRIGPGGLCPHCLFTELELVGSA